IVDRHRQRFLTKPTTHCVDVKACFDEQRTDRMPQSMESEAWLNGPFPFEAADSLDEGRIKAALRPGRPVCRRCDCDRVMRSRGGKEADQVRMQRDRHFMTRLGRTPPDSSLANRRFRQ